MMATQDSNGDYIPNSASELAQCYTEAIEDSRSLQALADDLLDTLIRTQCELAEAQLTDSQSSRIDVLCILGNLILSLQNIQKDVALNIESFSQPPRKTFFQSNIEQLTSIYQLLWILPSLHPFIPHKTSDGSSLDERLERFVSEQREQREQKSEEREQREYSEKREEAACFTRQPRSMSVLPLARLAGAELGVAGPVSTWH